MIRGVYFGEITNSYAPSEEQNINGLRFEYDVRCIIEGNAVVFQNAMLVEPATGVDNFHEVVLRSSKDDEGAGGTLPVEPREAVFRSGDRVLVAFADSNAAAPVILGTLPHPAVRTIANGDSEDAVLESLPALSKTAKPQLRGRYNGFQYRVDETGQARLQHSGVATIKIDQGNFSSKEDEPVTSLTTLDFLSKGSFRLVDNNRQALVVDAEKKFLSLNNTTTAPTEEFLPIAALEIEEPNDEQAPVGQEVRLDQASQTLSLLTSDKLKMIVGGDSLKKIFGSQNTEIYVDETRTVAGNFTETIAGSSTINVGQNMIATVSENIGLISESGSSIFIDASPGSEGIYLGHTTGAQVVLDKDGSIKIFAKDGTFIFVNGKSGEISMTSASGALVTVKDNIVLTNSAGSETVTLRSGNVEINSGGNVTVSGTNVNVNAGAVSLGAGATFSAVVGEILMTWLSTHTHATAVGPSSPPIVPPLPTILSQSVKVKA